MITLSARQKLVWLGFVAPCVIVLLSFVIFPLVYSLRLSFTDMALTFRGYSFVGFRNYSDLIHSVEARKTLANTLLFVVSVVGGELALGFLLASLLARVKVGRSAVIAIVAIPSLVAPTAVGAIWKLLMQPNGLINYLLGFIGIHPIDWLGNPSFALFSIVIADIWQWTPFVGLILLAGFTSIDPTLYEAAAVDGASAFQKFRFITLPSIQSFLAFAILFRAIDAMRFMDKVWMITRGGPGIASQTAAVYIYLEGFRFFRIGYSSAASWLLLVLIAFLTSLLLRYVKEQA